MPARTLAGRAGGVGTPTWAVEITRPAGRATILPDGRFVVVETARDAATLDTTHRLVVRSAETGAVERESPESDWGPDRGLLPSDGRWVAGVRGSLIRVWSLADLTRCPLELTTGSRKEFTGIAFHPSGRYLAASGNDGTARFYETGTWAPARTYDWEVGKLRSIAFSADGCVAAAGGDAGRVVVWDVAV